METVLAKLASESLAQRKEALDELLTLVRTHHGALPVPNVPKFFMLLQTCVQDPDWDISLQCLQLLQELMPVAASQDYGPDLETNFCVLLPTLVEKLADDRPSMLKNAQAVVILYIKLTRNLENVFSALIRHGLQSDSVFSTQWRLRLQALLSIEPFLRMDLSFAASVAEMKRLFEQVLGMVRDSAVTVQKAARKTTVVLSGLIPNFEVLLDKLTPGQQSLYQDEVAGKNVRTSQEMKLLRSTLRNSGEGPPPHHTLMEPLDRSTGGYAFQSSSISNIAQTLAVTKAPQVKMQSNTAPNGLEFGFVPSDLMAQLRDSTNWRSRASAIQELEGLISTTEDFESLMPYMAAFFRLLKELLEDSNFKVTQSTLGIIGALVAIPNISKRANIAQLLPSCRDKLGDNKIAIRQAAFRVIKAFIREAPPRVLFPYLEEGLESENWHIREEVAQLIITAMLLQLPDFDYDFFSLLPVFCRMLRDSKPKVKFAATEAIAVLAHLQGAELVLEEAEKLIEEDSLEALRARLEQTHLPVLQEDFVEFPKLMPASAPIIAPAEMFTMYPQTDEKILSPMKPPVEVRPAELSSNESTEDTSISPQPDLLKFGGVRRMAASSLDFHPRRPNRVTRRLFAFRENSIGQSRDLPPPASLRPPYIPINMTTKAGGSSKKVSYGYQVRASSLAKRNIARYRTQQSLEDAPGPQASTESLDRAPPAVRRSAALDPVKTDQSLYLKAEELPPVSHPEEEFQQCLNNCKSQEWAVQFETLNMIRRLLRHHPGVFLTQTNLHTIVLGVLKMADSLRSSLAKNSLIVITEMSDALKRALDTDAEVLSSLLLRKCADTNVFISEEAEKALASLCSNCTGNRVAATLLSQSSFAKSSQMKTKIASGFRMIFEKSLGFVHKIKDVDRIISTLSGYTSDASQEVRANARLAFLALRAAYGSYSDFDRVVSRSLPDAAAIKLREVMDTEPNPTAISEAIASPRRVPLTTRKPLKTPIEPQDPDFADIPLLAADITHSEWKRRYDAVDRTLSLITTHSDSLKRSARLVTVIDLLNKALSDSNLSVTLHALSGMTKVMPMLAGTLEPHSTLMMHALVVAVGSANSAIRDAARHSLHALMRNCDFTYSIPALMGVIPVCAQKAKPTLLAMLCGERYADFLPEVHAKKPSLVHKHVLPLTFKLLDDPKQEIRSECYKLVHALYAVIGSVLVECTPASKLQKVMDLLNE